MCIRYVTTTPGVDDGRFVCIFALQLLPLEYAPSPAHRTKWDERVYVTGMGRL